MSRTVPKLQVTVTHVKRHMSSVLRKGQPIQKKVLPTKFIDILDVDDVKRGVHIFDSEPPREDLGHPPLIILSGTAQSIQTWAPHVSHFAKNRRVIIPELRGQGSTELISKHANLNQQIRDLHEVLKLMKLTKIGPYRWLLHCC